MCGKSFKTKLANKNILWLLSHGWARFKNDLVKLKKNLTLG